MVEVSLQHIFPIKTIYVSFDQSIFKNCFDISILLLLRYYPFFRLKVFNVHFVFVFFNHFDILILSIFLFFRSYISVDFFIV